MNRIHPFEDNRMVFFAENGDRKDLKPIFGKIDEIEKVSSEDSYFLEVTYTGHTNYSESFYCKSLEERDEKYNKWTNQIKEL